MILKYNYTDAGIKYFCFGNKRTAKSLQRKLEDAQAVLAILFAAIILSNPFASTIVLWQVAAISLIVEAVLDVVVLIVTEKEKII